MKEMIWLHEESGQGIVEYGSILVGVSIIAIALLRSIAGKAEAMFQSLADSMP